MRKVVVIGLILGVLVLFFVSNPSESSWFVACPFRMVTGYDCPGCGSQRALHQLLHLNFKQAFLLNPLLFIFATYTLIGLILKLNFFKKRCAKLSDQMFGMKAVMIAIILILIFFILRNTDIYLGWIKGLSFMD